MKSANADNRRLRDRGVVDHDKMVRFSFNGRQYKGRPGDTLASALIANGEHFIARSFKYHRPRGIVGAGSEDPAGMVQVGTDPLTTQPNVRATEQELFEGLEANSQNCWPSLKYDIASLNNVLSPFFPAGFYYKTFLGPPLRWSFFEPIIRAAAGLGVAPQGTSSDRCEHVNRHVDVLVIGTGAAGLQAASLAVAAGARVMLCEETPHLGGQLLSAAPGAIEIGGEISADWIAEKSRALHEAENATVLTRTCATGYFTDNLLTLWEKLGDHTAAPAPHAPRHRIWRVRAKKVILATGAIERPLVFHQNDRPGIMLASAARTFLNRYGVLAAERPLIFTNNDSAYQTAFDMQDAGAKIAAIVDCRPAIEKSLQNEVERRGLPLELNSVITGTSGTARVCVASVSKLIDRKTVVPDPAPIRCDLIATSGGWTPNVALFSQSRGKLKFDDRIGAFVPGMSWQNEVSVGACSGGDDTDAAVNDATDKMRAVLEDLGFNAAQPDAPTVSTRTISDSEICPMWQAPSDVGQPKAFVDLQDDVTAKDLALAVKEGYQSVEHAKRYTTQGMGTDQGKISNMNAFGILSGVLGKTIPEVGTTTFRQPYKAVPFGAIAGQHFGAHFQPRRTTAMHDWHVNHGAVFEPVGDWLRAWVYPVGSESPQEAVQREAKATRTSVGILDASTLGKIDVRGSDAREFLTRVYTNAWMKLKPGRCRYGLMLGEDGMVMDDGVTACMADDHFHMTTTTGGAARVYGMLEDYLQTEWPDLDVYLTSVTEQWAVASLSGPNSPKVMAKLFPELDLSEEEFPLLAWKNAELNGVPVRIFRISFTGEESYEINIPSRYGAWLWEQVMAAGSAYEITPYGTETMHLLRAEKGFIIVGQDTDGTVSPHDLGMSWIVKKNGDFIGRRSLTRSDTARSDRKQLVGLLSTDQQTVLEEGAHIIETEQEPAPPVPMLGHVTSSYMSPNLGRPIAMALVASGRDRMGETLYVTCGGGKPVEVVVTGTDFLGSREAKPDTRAAKSSASPRSATVEEERLHV